MRAAANLYDELRAYTYLRILNILHLEFHRDFHSGFTGAISFVAMLLIYASLTVYDLVPVMLYLFFPSFAFFCIMLLTVFYPYICSWEEKSYELMHLWKQAMLQSKALSQIEKLALRKRLKATQPVRNQLSHFCYNSVDISQECIGQIFGGVLLLLSF